ncbi:hypothetical protein [Sinomonas sp. ASV322]|uniref:hypothetical protein n=1 Tax=Sinomonas sp. ASV322 TaxID=3041920 RepID=UPI0027DE364F|nr:hypothetical protein [Sinomonas sp. ASV322]MDQ4504091.1 hypothetical protein [Sinomonas sp. ASV322]
MPSRGLTSLAADARWTGHAVGMVGAAVAVLAAAAGAASEVVLAGLAVTVSGAATALLAQWRIDRAWIRSRVRQAAPADDDGAAPLSAPPALALAGAGAARGEARVASASGARLARLGGRSLARVRPGELTADVRAALRYVRGALPRPSSRPRPKRLPCSP